jgi:GTP-binding protein Era
MDRGELHAGFCAISGLPNVGKSTLLNHVLGLRLVAVSPKPQTTRNRVVGVKNLPGAQLAFVDTPGIQTGHNALRRYMRDEALAAAGACDVALLLIDATDPRQTSPKALKAGPADDLREALAVVEVPVIVGLNKVDQVKDKPALLPMLAAFGADPRFVEVVPISAKSGTGVDALLAAITSRLPVGPQLFPDEMFTDRPERFLAGELVREQLFLQLGAEVPYATAVVIEDYEDRPDRGDVVIRAAVFVERDSQKGIVVGKGGARIKQVGEAARAEIGRLLDKKVHLVLNVRVSTEWSDRPDGLRKMGYE